MLRVLCSVPQGVWHEVLCSRRYIVLVERYAARGGRRWGWDLGLDVTSMMCDAAALMVMKRYAG